MGVNDQRWKSRPARGASIRMKAAVYDLRTSGYDEFGEKGRKTK